MASDGPGVMVGEVTYLHETDKAIKVDTEAGDERWIPKSQIHDDSEIYGGHNPGTVGKLIVTEWFARKEGLG